MIVGRPVIDPSQYPPMTTWRVFPIQLPSLVLGWLYVLIACGIGLGRGLHVDQGVLCAYWRPWCERGYTTTIGHGMLKSKWYDDATRFHERVHIWLYEDLCFVALVLGFCLMPWVGWQGTLVVWATGGSPWLLPLFPFNAARWARKGLGWFKPFYFFSFWERGAYSETKSHRDGEHDRWEL